MENSSKLKVRRLWTTGSARQNHPGWGGQGGSGVTVQASLGEMTPRPFSRKACGSKQAAQQLGLVALAGEGGLGGVRPCLSTTFLNVHHGSQDTGGLRWWLENVGQWTVLDHSVLGNLIFHSLLMKSVKIVAWQMTCAYCSRQKSRTPGLSLWKVLPWEFFDCPA